ncbi:uroporphyrinogen decarboxylase family protein [Candidatus Formimonas warabiya]|uniref:Uroporphyrinogen decarboxylase (URO-D) domain-containing protein n=1 Tax=Formimonas warabiya TaxID=1761012 RepID=A0A3G1KZH3_FORW1|nr:uroporphyrinogen decarboxylase family protein [Candidatus Formimonas warabiya]ATW27791.1 hypothetical protein DCMF_26260 [Candidatus Formimonas warabiya]
MKRSEFVLDEMTPLERAAAMAAGRDYDRIPCRPSLGEQPTRLTGVTVSQYLNSARIMAEAHLQAFKIYGHDGVSVGPDQFGLPEALGAKMAYYVDDIPQVPEPAVKTYRDLTKLKMIDPFKDGRFPLYWEALDILRERMGHLVKVGTGIGGPFTAAALLRGTANFLKDLRQHPEDAHRLLAFTTDNIIRYLEACREKGFGCGLGEPCASNTLISPRQFQDFVQPYLSRIGAWFREKTGGGYSLHICGKTRKIWLPMVESGASSISLDGAADLGEAKKVIGHRVGLRGSVSPVEVMFQGDRESILRAAKECIMMAYDSPKGYVLGTGCRVPLGTSRENIVALMDGARMYGKMPLERRD